MPRHAKKKKNVLKVVLIVLTVYFAVMAAGAWLYDGRHAQIVLYGAPEVTVEYGTPYVDAGAQGLSVGRLFGTEELETVTEGAENISEIGEYLITYRCIFRKQPVTLTRRVTVRDTQAPVITLVPTVDFNAREETGYAEPGFTAWDNHDGDITANVKVEMTDNTVHYYVSDASGNEAEPAVREIVWAPSAPVIVLDGGDKLTVTAALQFSDPGYRAYDASGANITDLVTVKLKTDKTAQANPAEPEPEFTPYLPGTYTLVYSVETGGGLKTEVEREITVVAAELPESKAPAVPTIYLTFDDGPGEYTGELLDILKKYNVKVTFFVTNQFPDYADLITREAAEGHTVAIHTYGHSYKQIYSGVEAYWADMQQMRELIYEKTGTYTNMFRFPGGSSNTESRFNPGIMTTLSKALPALGYKAFDWNVDSGDAGGATKPETVFKNVSEGIEAQMNYFGYAVVLQHDIKEYSVKAVEEIIRWGLSQGYTFAALDMTSPRAWHTVYN